MKKLYVLFVLASALFLNVQGQVAGDFRSIAAGPGNWNDFNAWERFDGTVWVPAIAGQVPTATSAVEIQATHSMVINATGLTSGNLTVNGSLTYDATTVSALTVSGNVTVGVAGSFTSPSSGTVVTHALGVSGDLTVNGIFNMNVFSTAGVVTTFTGATNNVITGTGTTINFYSIVVNKGTAYTNILDVTSVITIAPPVTTGMRLTLTNGTFKLSSASSLTPYYGLQYITTTNSRLWLNNTGASVSNVGAGTITGAGRLMVTAGRLHITAGTFSYGSGSDIHSFSSFLTLDGPSATLNLYGSMQLAYGVTFTMTDGNINLYPQAGNNLTSYAVLSMESWILYGPTYSLTGGTITIVDPPAPGTTIAAISAALTLGTINMAGSTIRLGDGTSDKPGSANGFLISSAAPFGNVIVNNNPASVLTTRVVKLNGALKIGGNLTINSGTANQFILNNNSLTLGGSLTNSGTFTGDGNPNNSVVFNGTTQQVISGSGTFTNGNINNITVNNTSGASPSLDLQVPLSVSNSMTLTNGILGTTNSSVLTIGRSASSVTFNMTRSGGSLSVVPAYSLTGVTLNAFSYTAPTPPALQTTGGELPPSQQITTFTINNSGGVTLDKAVSCGTLALTSGILTATAVNSITVTGTAVGSITGGSATAYVNGPLTRTFPNNASAANYKFFIGKTTYHLFEYQSITTGGTGTATLTAEVFDNGPYPGSPGAGLATINTDKMWRLSGNLGSVTITSSQIRITEGGLVLNNRIGQSNVYTGPYNNAGGILGTGTISSRIALDYSNITSGTYFRIGTQGTFPAGTFAIGPYGPYTGYSKWYPTLQLAIDSASDVILTGNVIFEFQPDYNPSVEIFPVTISTYLAGSVSSSVTVRPASSVISLINFTGTGNILNNTGADYVTFDGRPGGTGPNQLFQFTSTSTTLPTVSLSGDAQYNRFFNCIFKGSNTTAASGILSISAPSVSGNNYYTIDSCNFDASNSAKNCLYTTSTASGATIQFNNFFNYQNGGGIYLASGSPNSIIDNNNFYQTVSYNAVAGTAYGIFVSSGDNYQISNNNIGGSGPGLTGTWTISPATPVVCNFTGISASTGATVTSRIYNNKIQNFDWKTNAAATWTGITFGGNANVGTNGANYVGDNTTSGNILVTGYTAGALTVQGIVTSATAGFLENNIIGSLKTAANAAVVVNSTFYPVYFSGSQQIRNNVIGSPTAAQSIYASTTGGTNNISGIFCRGSVTTITGNTIANLYNASAGANRGIDNGNNGSVINFNNNTIFNITTTGAGASIIGIFDGASGTSTSNTISGNTIYNLENTGTGATTVYGIQFSGNDGSTSNVIEKNLIHSFNTTSGTATQTGINMTYGTAVMKNNVVRLGIDINGNSITSTAQINGIYVSVMVGCCVPPKAVYFDFNTVYIGGSGVAAGTPKSYAFVLNNHGSYGGTGNGESIRNNIFVNMRTNAVANKQHYAISIPAKASSPWSCDYNIYNVSATDGILASVAGVNKNTLGWLQDAYPGSDLHSGFGDPLMAHPADAIATMDLKPVNLTPAEANGTLISSVTDDFAGLTRSANTPTDIGAYAGNFTPPGPGQDIFFPVITYNPLGNTSITTGRTTHNWATITDNFTGVNVTTGTRPRVYYKLSTDANAFVGNTAADNGWKWVESTDTVAPFDFNFDYSILFSGPVALGSIIQYFAVAQDMATVPNLSFNPANGALGIDVSPTGMTAPTTPYSYTIVQSVPSAMNVGTGYPYTSLTGTLASGGLFAAINAGVINANTVATIKTDIAEPGTVSLNLVSEEGVGEGTLTFTVQSDGIAHVLTGNVTTASAPMIPVTGAKRFIIDGGAGKFLTLRNNNATAANTGPVVKYDNSSQNDTLKNCYIESNAGAAANGAVTLGTTGINNITITQCDIRDARVAPAGSPTSGIYSNSTGNTINIINNNIYNFKNAATYVTAYAINLPLVANGCLISGNSIYMESGITPVSPLVGIYFWGTNSHTISGNFIGGTAPNCGGTLLTITGAVNFKGMYFQATSPGATIQGNTIQNFSMTSTAAPTFYAINNYFGPITITGNTIGSPTTVNSIQIAGTGISAGIYNSYPSAFYASIVENNTIANVTLTNATGSPSFRALWMTGGTVRKNIIHSIGSSAAALTPSIYGIYNSTGLASNEYSNNLISLNGGNSTNPQLFGFYDASAITGTSGFYYNSINLYGTATGANVTYAYFRAGAAGYILNNNILANLRTGTGTHYAICSTLTTSFTSDDNHLYTAGAAFGLWGGVAKTNIAAWQSIPQDINSVNVSPSFISVTDLHTTVPQLNNGGQNISGITDDLSNVTRTNPPDIGVYEFTLPVTAINTLVATSVTQTDAVLNGNISSNNEVVAMSFEYGLTNAYGNTVTATVTPIRSLVLTATSATLTGLIPNSLYHYRIKGVSTTSSEVVYGLDMTFDLVPTPTITGPATVCAGVSGNVYTTEAGKSNYLWTVSAGGTITAGGTLTDNTVTITWNTAGAQTVSVNYQNSVGVYAPTPTSYSVTVNPSPVPTIAGTNNLCVGSTGIVYTTQSGMTSYNWTVSAGGTITSGGTAADTSVTVTWNTAGAQSVSVNYSNSFGCSALTPTVYPVTVNPFPVPAITGNNVVCAPVSGMVYTTQSGMTNYVWTVSAGGTITAGGSVTDSTITITWNTAGAQSVSVNYTNANGCTGSSPTVYPVTVNPRPVPAITGTNNLCAGTTGVLYSTQGGMTDYQWTVSAGGTITAGGTPTDTSATVTWNSAGAQSVSINYTNSSGCNASAATVYPVTVNPLPVPTITGTNNLCAGTIGVVYATQAGMANYTWAISAGGIITAGGTPTDSTVTVTWNTAGAQSVSVNYANSFGCTAASATVYPVTVNPLPIPVITGNNNVCAPVSGVVYTTQAGMTNYIWFVSAGGTITAGGSPTDTSVNVTWNTVGAQSVTVNYTNSFGCMAPSPTVLSVTVNNRPSPTISGINNLCAGSSGVVYNTQAGMTNYIWVISPGGFIIAGGTATDASVTVTWNSAGARFVSINYTNAAGCSAVTPTNYPVTVNPLPVPTITGINNVCAGATGLVYSTQAGMSNYNWMFSAGATVTSGGTATDSTVTITWNTAGAQSVNVNYTNSFGCTAISPTFYPVTVNPRPVPAITGTNNLCAGASGVLYSTQSGMTNYLWTVSAGGTITAGGTPTDTSVTVTWNTAGAQSVSVNYITAAGCTAATPTIYPVTVNPLPVPTITGTNNLCAGTIGVVYATQAGMANYAWAISAGGTITAGGTPTDTSVTVTWNTAGAQSVSVNYTNAAGCSAATPTIYPVTVSPTPVITIAGNNNLCAGTTGVVYTTQGGMTAYSWTVSAGGTITAGGTPTDTSVTVTWNTAGAQSVSVNYTNAAGCTAASPTIFNVTVNSLPTPVITGPLTPCSPSAGNIYSSQAGMTAYTWAVSAGGTITAGGTAIDSSVTVTWNSTPGAQSISVNYTNASGCTAATPMALNINTIVCSPQPISALTIPQFVDPLPHFAGLRVNAKSGGNLIVKAVPHQQIALSTGTVLNNNLDTIGRNPSAGLGNFWTYSTSKDNGATWTPPLWPAFTIETQRGNPVTVTYRNDLFGQTYASVNLTVDQSIHWAMPTMTPDPYSGPVPIVPHLHGGEVPSESDGGPYAWFTPGFAQRGPTWGIDGVDSVYYYPNSQEAGTLWFHDHAMGATRLNVYAGLAAFYLLRGTDEETDQLAGWSGDDLVKEVAPAGKSPTFQANAYLPEVELAVQDRMFNDRGGLFWPNNPPNPSVHPYWTPEFYGDVMMVNGKSWPYFSVAPRKYRFRVMDGCNARFLNMWLKDLASGANGPAIKVVGSEGGMLDNPIILDPATGGRLFMAPGERFDIIIDFSAVAPGSVWTLVNDAAAPYPMGTVPDPLLDGRIMQFVVNGEMRSAANPADPGIDKSLLPASLRSVPIVRLTNNAGGLNITPDKKRQLTLNENAGAGGPLEVLLNNSHFDNNGMAPGSGYGNLTENPKESTAELWQIINTTMDAHPIHFHLVQLQLVSRQAYNTTTFDAAYNAAFPGGTYIPAAGPPAPYDVLNSDGSVGGNPSISTFLTGPVIAARPEEMGWKDTYQVNPGEVTTFLVRWAPTDKPLNAPPANLLFGFDPSKGPGYVWHCHIVDHEDNEMMRPDWIEPSPLRSQQLCVNSSANVYHAPKGMTNYIWTISAGGTITAGGTPSDSTATVTWNAAGTQWVKVYYTSGTHVLTVPSYFPVNVNPLPVPTIAGNNTACTTVAGNVYTTQSGMTAYSWTVSAGGTITAGGTPTDTSVTVTWNTAGAQSVSVNYITAAGCTVATPTIYPVTVNPTPVPTITGINLVCTGTTGNVYTTEAGQNSYVWTVSAGGTITAGGTPTDTSVTITWNTAGAQSVSVNYTNASGCSATSPVVYNVSVVNGPTPSISGLTSVCVSITGVIYTTEAEKTNYVWAVSAGGTITAGGTATDNTVTVTWNTVGIQSVSVNYSLPGGCSAASPTVYDVTVNPLPVPTITGTNNLCAGSSGIIYSTQTGMTNYQWAVSAGGTITAGGTPADTSVTVTWNTAGAQSVSVNYTNASGCNAATPTIFSVTVNPLPVPTITGNNNICAGTTGVIYTTEAGMTNYAWTVSAGGTITGGGTSTSRTVTVRWNTAGAQSVSVNYQNANGCTAPTPTVYPVTVNPIPVPTISGPNSVCVGTTGNIYFTEPGNLNYEPPPKSRRDSFVKQI